jgi:DNA-binding response OmpR family regulator
MARGRRLEGKRVMVVDDNYLIAMMLCDVMQAAGAVAIGPVGTSAEAMKLAMHAKLDGVLLELNLPGGGGMQVVEYLRSRKVPVVLVTGYDRLSLDPRVQDLPYLSKPTAASDLVEQMAAALDRLHEREQPK